MEFDIPDCFCVLVEFYLSIERISRFLFNKKQF